MGIRIQKLSCLFTNFHVRNFLYILHSQLRIFMAQAKWPEPVRKVLNAYRPILEINQELVPGIGTAIPIPEISTKLIIELCDCYIPVLQQKEALLELDAPVYILGDIHGNIFDLLRLLIYTDVPPKTRLVFLGDYVDRGEFSIEVITLLFAFGVAFPDHMILLRGNHEFEHVNQTYGFYDECITQRGSQSLYQSVNRVFQWLPFAAVVGGKFFCVHGGLSPALTSLKQIKAIQRPMEIYDGDLVCDLVWSDPQQTGEQEYVRSQRGSGVLFGPPAIAKFLKETNLSYIVRGHECVTLGVQKFGETLYTVFSSSNYEDGGNNRAGLMFIDATGKIELFSLPPIVITPRSECVFSKPLAKKDAWGGSAVALNLKLADVRKDMAKSFESIKNPFMRNGVRRNQPVNPRYPWHSSSQVRLPRL